MHVIKRNRGRSDLDRQQRASEWGKLIAVAVGLLLVMSFFFDDMGIPQYWAMRNQEQQLEREIRELKVKNAELHLEVDRLRYDPERLEELAREQLGFVRKGETVYQLAPSVPPVGAGSVLPR